MGSVGPQPFPRCWQRQHHPAEGQRGADLDRLWPVLGRVERPLGPSQPRRHGRGAGYITAIGTSDCLDDRWHFAVATYDGTALRLYIDGVLEAVTYAAGLIFPSTGPFNVGGYGADAANGPINDWIGRICNTFVHSRVLDPVAIRLLYAAKIPHGLAVAPTQVSLGVRASKRGPLLAAADFPAQPLHIYNLNNSLADLGSLALGLASNGGPIAVAGPAGDPAGALNFVAASGQWLSASDAGLPAGVATRSYGGWFKCGATTADSVLLSWGTTGTGDTKLYIANADGTLHMSNAGSDIAGPFVRDGQWHHVALVEQNGGPPRRGLWLDGRLVATSSTMNAITLSGATGFRIGANPDGTLPFNGQIARVFVLPLLLTGDQIASVYAGAVALGNGPSPKAAADHIEAMDAQNVYAIFDSLNSSDSIDLTLA